ncbi:52 kDa repressor of the inhibitor of the protein kinase isoform X1 [Drosophila sulfurigaster albostrigata]|uniref:52 kDa repressor of the inhibitor of the protein kinase isoform X1 n=1 Tax=Drosophila sulfurigaster albostrigata TaxID=89887 RepID=UPI002D21E2A3|nr:52 kDa repressor of the inhibitor of the protein kinase isoform X1 [Drosophila sulfurigaster albostrigata]
MRCAVSNCGNNNRNGNRKKWRYFHFPKDKKQLQKWIEFCERDIPNTATACICNEHFTPDDFERNMQYELGFTRKNPTKLKPNSCPTVRCQHHKALAGNVKRKRGRAKKDAETHGNDEDCFPTLNKPEEETDVEGQLDCPADLAESEENELIEFTISEMEEYGPANDTSSVDGMDIEIIDSLSPQTTSEEHVEIIDSESDSYVKHLELEVSTLKRQVFFLKDERKKLIEEIQNLRAKSNQEVKSEEKLTNVTTIEMFPKSTKTKPTIKKTVLLYTANIDTIRNLRRTNNLTD